MGLFLFCTFLFIALVIFACSACHSSGTLFFFLTHAHTHTHMQARTHTHTHVGAYPIGRGSNPVEGKGHFFPHIVGSIFRLSLTRFIRLWRRSLQMLDVAVPQIGVGVFHAWLFRGGADGWVTKVFVSTDATRPGERVSQRHRFESRRGKRALFSLIPSALSFVFLWHTHTHARVRAVTVLCHVEAVWKEARCWCSALESQLILIMICKRGYNISWNTLCTPEVWQWMCSLN